MIKTSITCDGCGEIIEGRPGYPRNECLSLSLMNIPTAPSLGTFLVSMKPKLDREYHFHSVFCLSKWEKMAEEVKKVVDFQNNV